ncbi:MAG TPA: sialate O-acetylesterase [Bryobacteraceae bacterium]|nr:sialate O-acetylesterase [Bryobacteraceae bacterium]
MANRTFRACLLGLAAVACLQADVRLPALIGDHMMLQRDLPVRLWGNADAGEPVNVSLAGKQASTVADALGRWSVSLAPLAAGGPFDLTIQGKNALRISDVLIGEVWVASGQSNMEWPMARVQNAETEIAAAAYPSIRVFQVAKKVSDTPLPDVTGKWSRADGDSVRNFSAVGYFFARHLHQKLGIPIGVIHSSWGGTPAESWTSAPTLTRDPALTPLLHDWALNLSRYPETFALYEKRRQEWADGDKKAPQPQAPRGPGHPWTPGGLYNAMIAPLTPYAIRGAIWYQGESNADVARVGLYQRLFTTMIEDWRRAWGLGEFPFLFVQLANFAKTGQSDWPNLREAQRNTLSLRNTGMAVTTDIGNPDDIHPTNKQDVGLRLALQARSVAYGERLVASGPMFKTASVEPHGMRVWFDSVGAGLKLKAGGTDLQGFTIAGADRKFVPATARIEGSTVLVSSPGVAQPVAVRYNWADNPDGDLYNTEGLPASPFRSKADF